MNPNIRVEETRTSGDRVLGGVLTILVSGIVLGLAYNAIGGRTRLPWVAEDAVAAMPGLAPAQAQPARVSDDPMALPANAAALGLPEVPDLGRPIQVEIDAFKRFFDAGAALIIDARDPDEYAAGHIAGAISLPYDEAVTDPTRLERLQSGGRAIVTYCGGGTCEVSVNLAEELVLQGHRKVLVYMGGFPEWAAAGYPVETGSAGS